MAVIVESLQTAENRQQFIADFCSLGEDLSAAESAYLDLVLPFYQESGQLFLARVMGQPVARLAASLSQSAAHHGGLGLLSARSECPHWPVVATALLDAGTTWLKDRAVDKVFAPIDVNTWFRFRMPVDAAIQGQRFSWEPQVNGNWQHMLEKTGFSPAVNFHTAVFHTPHLQPALSVLGPHVDKAKAEGFSFRSFGDGVDERRDLRLTYEFSHVCFQASPLFESIDFNTYERAFGSRLAAGAGETSFFLCDATGHEVGFIFAFIEAGYLIVKSIYVLPTFVARSAGRWAASAALLHRAIAKGLEIGVRGGVAAMMRDDATSQLLVRWQRWMKPERREYALWSRQLDAASEAQTHSSDLAI